MLDGLEQDAFEVMGDALRPMLDLCRLVEETDEDAVVQ